MAPALTATIEHNFSFLLVVCSCWLGRVSQALWMVTAQCDTRRGLAPPGPLTSSLASGLKNGDYFPLTIPAELG